MADAGSTEETAPPVPVMAVWTFLPQKIMKSLKKFKTEMKY